MRVVSAHRNVCGRDRLAHVPNNEDWLDSVDHVETVEHIGLRHTEGIKPMLVPQPTDQTCKG